MNLLLLASLLLAPGAGERDNRRGIEAWHRADTSASVRHFESALAADTMAADYAFNAATAKSLAGKDGEAEFARALARAADRDERARVLYNRGTARLRKAMGAPQGQGDVSGAISDLREALKLRPSWKDASRNLERALRLRPPPRPQQTPKDPKGGDGPKNQPKPDSGDPKPQETPPSQAKQPSPSNPSDGMDPRDARRLLDGAAAREAQQAKETKQRKNEDSDGPDW